MGFKFSYVCDLLSQPESNRTLKATTAAKRIDPDFLTVTNWFNRHSKHIHDGKTDRLALLSCVFPQKRPDRVYGLREYSLANVISRSLLLGMSRVQDLELWRSRGGGDLGQCVENVMRQAENHIHGLQEVTVEEVDLALAQIASNCRFSGSSVRRSHSAVKVDNVLRDIFRRLSSRDGKWLTRMILKDYSPVVVPEKLVLKKFHFIMPSLLTFQDSMEAAMEILSREPIVSLPPRPSRDYERQLMQNVMAFLPPRIGVKIGRPDFYKARGLKHCCNMVGKRTMSLEKKYDGEYCQIHIDLSRGHDCIQIFSKSGKDSTEDRRGVHQAIKECLRIGKPDCKFKDKCIMEGELLIWGAEESAILPLYKLRKHVSRSGSFIGADGDSPPNPNERLYIVFFDILLLDSDICLSKPYAERRRLLCKAVNPTDGVGVLAEQETVNFALPDAFEHLKSLFSLAAAERWEELVLKGSDEPYFTLKQYVPGDLSGHWIKMKKEYIMGLGDTADFALVGARYDSRDAANLYNVKPLFWTSFYIGCLANPQEVSGYSAQPIFRVVDILDRNSMTPQIMQFLNQHGQFYSREFGSENPPFALKIDQAQLPRMDVIFRKPFVVDLTGFGFERPQNVRYFSLRFPRIVKIHSDRTFRDATTFEELQQLAETARSVPEDELSQEMTIWAERLDPKGGARSEYIVDQSGSEGSSLRSGYSSSSDSDDDEDHLIDVKDTTVVATQQFTRSSPQSCGIGVETKRALVANDAPETPKKRKLSIIVIEDSSEPMPMPMPPVIVLEDSPEPIPPVDRVLAHKAALGRQESHVSGRATPSHIPV